MPKCEQGIAISVVGGLDDMLETVRSRLGSICEIAQDRCDVRASLVLDERVTDRPNFRLPPGNEKRLSMLLSRLSHPNAMPRGVDRRVDGIERSWFGWLAGRKARLPSWAPRTGPASTSTIGLFIHRPTRSVDLLAWSRIHLK